MQLVSEAMSAKCTHLPVLSRVSGRSASVSSDCVAAHPGEVDLEPRCGRAHVEHVGVAVEAHVAVTHARERASEL